MDQLMVAPILTKVGGECEKLLADQHVQGVDGSIAQNFVPLDLVMSALGNSKIFAGLGDVNLITFHGSVVGVMTVMGDPPREVWSP
jgi:hypothetical protein